MDIAIPLFDRMTALDAIGPYEVLSRLPGARVRFVARRARRRSRPRRRCSTLIADEALDDVPHARDHRRPGRHRHAPAAR